mmetsp:Transcript_46905/g.105116  ORF Transcript_46905/g.105116 Transcript_46905/m.105116 type:complete len:204 (+) Transcript_46905:157-768(+)
MVSKANSGSSNSAKPKPLEEVPFPDPEFMARRKFFKPFLLRNTSATSSSFVSKEMLPTKRGQTLSCRRGASGADAAPSAAARFAGGSGSPAKMELVNPALCASAWSPAERPAGDGQSADDKHGATCGAAGAGILQSNPAQGAGGAPGNAGLQPPGSTGCRGGNPGAVPNMLSPAFHGYPLIHVSAPRPAKLLHGTWHAHCSAL